MSGRPFAASTVHHLIAGEYTYFTAAHDHIHAHSCTLVPGIARKGEGRRREEEGDERRRGEKERGRRAEGERRVREKEMEEERTRKKKRDGQVKEKEDIG